MGVYADDMFIPIISIIILTAILFFFNRVRGGVVVCPICAATVLTWIALLIGETLNLFVVNNIFLAILMAISLGASIEKYGQKFGLLWKVLMVVLGGPAVYYLSQGNFLVSIYLLLALLFATALSSMQFSKKPINGAYTDTFKDCCN